MRQFFRAGFHQVDDRCILETSDNSYVFATPGDAYKPLLSLEETLNKHIVHKAPIRPEYSGLARELRLFVEKKTIEWCDLMDELNVLRGSTLENPRLVHFFHEFTSQLRQLLEQEGMLERSIQQRTLMHMKIANLEEALGKVRSARVDEERRRDEIYSRIQAITTETSVLLAGNLESLKVNVREEIKLIFDKTERPLQLVLDSDVIHVTTTANSMDLLEILLESLPASDKTKSLNGLDRFGLTPLMVVAGMAPAVSLAKCRQTMETLISMGANKNIVNASQGLSALGYFRDSKRQAEVPRMIFGFQEPSAEVQAEVSRIEAVLRPANGPTPADNFALETIDDSSSDSDDDDDSEDDDDSDDDFGD